MRTYSTGYQIDGYEEYEKRGKNFRGRVLASAASGSSTSSNPNDDDDEVGKEMLVYDKRPKIAVEDFFAPRGWTTYRYEHLRVTYQLAFRRFNDAFCDFLEKEIFVKDEYMPNIQDEVTKLRKKFKKDVKKTPEEVAKDAENTKYYEDVMNKFGLDPAKPIPYGDIPALKAELITGDTFKTPKAVVDTSIRLEENTYILKELCALDDNKKPKFPDFDFKKFNSVRNIFERSYGAQTEQRIREANSVLAANYRPVLDTMLLKYPWLYIYNKQRCGTAWTDGKSIGVSPIYFEIMTDKEIQFVILHECFHCVFVHMDQGKEKKVKIEKEAEKKMKAYEEAKKKDPNALEPLLILYNHQIMNIAMDHEVNTFIKYSLLRGDPEQEYVKDTSIMFDDDAVQGKKSSEITAIDAYDILIEQVEKKQRNNPSAIPSSTPHLNSKRYINKNVY